MDKWPNTLWPFPKFLVIFKIFVHYVLPINTNVHTYGVVYKGSLNSHNVLSEIRKQPILFRNALLLLWMFQYMVDKYSHIHTATWLARFISWLQWRYVHTTLPQIMARVFISSNNFTSWPLNKIGDYMKSVFITWSSESGWTILMAAGDTRVVGLLITMHHEMDSV